MMLLTQDQVDNVVLNVDYLPDLKETIKMLHEHTLILEHALKIMAKPAIKFVEKVERGEARSERSYKQFKEALNYPDIISIIGLPTEPTSFYVRKRL